MSDHQPSDPVFDPTDPLVKAWTGQADSGAPASLALEDPVALADSVSKAHRKEQRRLVWVNLREITAGLLVAGVFGSLASEAEHPAVTWIAAVLFLAVVGFLAASSISHHWADRGWDTSVQSQVARRLAQLNHRAGLYRNVAWWYYLPLIVATALFVYSMTGEFGGVEMLWTGVTLAVSVVMYWFVRRASRARYGPEIERLETLLVKFGEGATPDSTPS